MSSLDTLAGLLRKYGHAPRAELADSLAARDELRVDGFWQDLGADAVWGRRDSLASLDVAADSEAPDAERDRDRAAYRFALFELADDMTLRGVASDNSRWWAEELRGTTRRSG